MANEFRDDIVLAWMDPLQVAKEAISALTPAVRLVRIRSEVA